MSAERQSRFQVGDKVRLRNGREVTILAAQPDALGQIFGINDNGVYTNFPESSVPEPGPKVKKFVVHTEQRQPKVGEVFTPNRPIYRRFYEAYGFVDGTDIDALYRDDNWVVTHVEPLVDF